MARKEIYVCDGCGTMCDNPRSEKNWVQISGREVWINRYDGTKAKSEFLWNSDTIGGKNEYVFCSINCLVKKLDDKKKQREALEK